MNWLHSAGGARRGVEKREKRRLERFERLRLSKEGKKEDERLNWSTSGKEKCRKETNDALLLMLFTSLFTTITAMWLQKLCA